MFFKSVENHVFKILFEYIYLKNFNVVVVPIENP